MVNVNVPTISYTRGKGFKVKMFPIFKLFPVLLSITIMWALCGILTYTNVFEKNHPARTDSRIDVLINSPWFRIPYPGQFGLPTVTVSGEFDYIL